MIYSFHAKSSQSTNFFSEKGNISNRKLKILIVFYNDTKIHVINVHTKAIINSGISMETDKFGVIAAFILPPG